MSEPTVERSPCAESVTADSADDVTEVRHVIENIENACTHIDAAILLLRTDDGSRLGEAKAILRSVIFDLDNQMVDRSGLVERMEEYRSNG